MFNLMESKKFEDAVLYARVSSDDQQERETIGMQIEYGDKYADLYNINIKDYYKDDGVSGHSHSLEDRPDGKRLIEDAKAGKIKLVLIYNMKRLGRKARFILDAIYQLEQYGVAIRSMTEPFDTSTPTGRFIITLLAGQAEFDRDTLVETLWHGANRHARLGKWLGGIVPYGYRVDQEGFLEVNEDPLPGKEDLSEAGVIRLIYHLIADQKMTTIQVADYLNALSIPPSYAISKIKKKNRGKRKINTAGIWYPGRIGSVIRNTTYKGIHDYGKRSNRDREIIRREVVSIVSEEIWDRAQEVIRSNQLEATRNTKRPNLLRGLIKCGFCGHTYMGTAFSTGPRRTDGSVRKVKAYYVCNTKAGYKGSTWPKCQSKNVPSEWIEEVVWNECVNFILNPGDAIKELQNEMGNKRSQKEEYEKEIHLASKSIEEKEIGRQNILSLYRQKLITASDVEKQLQEIMDETINLEKRIKHLNQMIDEDRLVTTHFDSAEKLLLDFRSKIEGDLSFEIRRQIVKTLVKEIIVHTVLPPDGNPKKKKADIKVKFNFERPQDNSRTGARAAFLAMSPHSSSARALLIELRSIERKSRGHCLTGSICMWRFQDRRNGSTILSRDLLVRCEWRSRKL
ncbi:serine recombinase [Paenibacillus antibioticophila]|uniref:Serine recombinase n=1 Tax=Paenibacillus antibioticophila TaxID=1274374 RepID=A0A919XRM3_9BACL|nr:serine recombinase [Paenibacillus antibioticophila]